MKTLIAIVIAMSLAGCKESTGTVTENNQLQLPECRFIYIGGCKYLWCRCWESGGLEIFDPACRPANATVSDRPTSPENPTSIPD